MDAREADGTQSKRNGACHYPRKLTFSVTVCRIRVQSEKQDGHVRCCRWHCQQILTYSALRYSLREKAQEQHMYMWTLHNTVGTTF